jgi:hypothetical protein
VHESQSGAGANADDRGMRNAVEATVSRGQESVDVVAGIEGFTVPIDPAGPLHAGAVGVLPVDTLDPGPFPATELLHGRTADVLVGKAHGVHATRHVEAFLGPGDQVCLSHDQLGPTAGSQPGRVHTHTAFTDPTQCGAGVGEESDGSTGDASPWAK